MKKLDSKQEGTFAVIASLIVLFSAMLDPIVSIIISIAAFALYAAYKFTHK